MRLCWEIESRRWITGSRAWSGVWNSGRSPCSFTHRYAIRALRELAAPSACSEGRSIPISHPVKSGPQSAAETCPNSTYQLSPSVCFFFPFEVKNKR